MGILFVVNALQSPLDDQNPNLYRYVEHFWCRCCMIVQIEFQELSKRLPFNAGGTLRFPSKYLRVISSIQAPM